MAAEAYREQEGEGDTRTVLISFDLSEGWVSHGLLSLRSAFPSPLAQSPSPSANRNAWAGQ